MDKFLITRIPFCLLLITRAALLPLGEASQHPFKITGTVINDSYCATDDWNFALGGKVRLQFTNVGSTNLIVPANFAAPPSQFSIAVDENALSLGRFEFRSNNEWVVDAGTPPVEPSPNEFEVASSDGTKMPGTAFVILKPGEHVEATLEFGAADIPIDTHRTKLPPGRHVIQYDIGSWTVFYPAIKAEEYRERWRRVGFLVLDPLKTEPIVFDIASHPVIKSCKRSAK